jgi:hypothetical protein
LERGNLAANIREAEADFFDLTVGFGFGGEWLFKFERVRNGVDDGVGHLDG